MSDTTPHALSVSQAAYKAKAALEQLELVIVGEVSELSIKPNYKLAYFTIKDTKAVLNCQMWMNLYRACGYNLALGQRVIVTGKFSVYPARGTMSFQVESIQLEGVGDLREQVARIAQKLAAEGLCDHERKRPIPSMPQTIGLVTSPNGAAVHDVLRTLRRRWPVAQVKFAGVLVEGEQAARSIVDGLVEVVRAGVDVVLVVRGGGSFEALMPFNDERLARTIARCPVPVVTGIGHEPDTSIADMVADLRASTPTAAAEACAPDMAEIAMGLDVYADRMETRLTHILSVAQDKLNALATRPVLRDPHELVRRQLEFLEQQTKRLRSITSSLSQANDRLTDRALRLQRSSDFTQRNRETLDRHTQDLMRVLPYTFDRYKAVSDEYQRRLARKLPTVLDDPSRLCSFAAQRLQACGKTLVVSRDDAWKMIAARLDDLSPLHIVARGYSVARNQEGQVIRSIRDVKPHDTLSLSVSDGTVHATVTACDESVESSVSWNGPMDAEKE